MVVSRLKFQNFLDKGQFFKCYFLFGSEFFIIQKSVEQLVNLVVEKQAQGFNFTEFDGENLNFSSCSNVLLTIPVMSNYRVVLVKNLCYSKLVKADLKKFKQLIENIPTSSIFIVTFSIENFNYSEIKKFKIWLKHFYNSALIVDCSASSSNDLFNFCSAYALKCGSSISKLNFNFLVDRLSGNWQFIILELEKLSLYALGREIVKDDILLLTKPSLSCTAFDLAKEILNFNLEKSLLILQDLLNRDVNISLIVGAVNSCFVDLYRVFLCVKQGLSNSEISNFFNYKGQEFKINNARKICYKFNLLKLKKCILVLAELDLKLKSTSINRKLLLEQAIVEMTIGS